MALHLLERHMAQVFGVDVARLRERGRDRYATRYFGVSLIDEGAALEHPVHRDTARGTSEGVPPSRTPL
jgi:hypothetical protein